MYPTRSLLRATRPARDASSALPARVALPLFRSTRLCFFFLLASSFFYLVPPGEEAFAKAKDAGTPWQPAILDHRAVPGKLIAVDKSAQKLFLLERRSPLAQARQFTCSTGKKTGDKVVEGDLKTPEGIYFIVQHINSGLDFVKYGNEAYTLNYPNPVDKIRQKTGYGIWIHGRGEPIVPLQTEGCVAMINEDLAHMGSVFYPGMPVALTESFSIRKAPEGAAEVEAVTALEETVRQWANAWASRSESFFDFYDQKAYAVAQGEPFARFKRQKEHLFKKLPWIRVEIGDIHVLAGPGYWVTWFHQEYSAPNLSSTGVRRLYWQRNKKGNFTILGMEWVPGINTSTLLASAESALPPLEASPDTENEKSVEQNIAVATSGETKTDSLAEKAELQTVATTTNNGNAVLVASAEKTTKPPAEKAELQTVAEITDTGNAVLVASAEKTTKTPDVKQGEEPTGGTMPEPLLAPLVLMFNGTGKIPKGEWTGTMPTPEKKKKATETEKAPSAQDSDKTKQTNEPISSTGENSPALELLAATLEKAAKAVASTPGKPATLAANSAGTYPLAAPAQPADNKPDENAKAGQKAPHSPIVERPTENAPSSTVAQGDSASTAPASPDKEGETPPDTSRVAVVFGERTPAKAAPDSGTRETAAQDTAATVMEITGQILQWAQAWQAADLEAYASFYDNDAVQGNRLSRKAIQGHKEVLWQRSKPSKVGLNDLQVTVNGDAATVRMRQEYGSESGVSDTGYKTLELKKMKGKWMISREDWKAQPDG